MEIERRTLYNLLRMNWLQDPFLSVEKWQIEDYRQLSLEEIFEKLKKKAIYLDRTSFLFLAENSETPEDLSEELVGEVELKPEEQDQIYLLVFELWRRLVPEKLCLSIFCDELDYQIYLYDQEELLDTEDIQNVLANLEIILHENTDQGGDPRRVFESICLRCANDLENFLYDFTTDQIDNKNFIYANELVETFSQFVRDVKWFELLHIRLLLESDLAQAELLIEDILQEVLDSSDLEFNLEFLAILAEKGKKETFFLLLEKSAPLLVIEEEFQDLLNSYQIFLQRIGNKLQEKQIKTILNKRAKIPLDQPFSDKFLLAELLKF